MKKLLLILSLSLGLLSSSQACDVCGCGSGGAFVGLLPGTSGHFLGLRSQYASFNHPRTSLNFNGESRVISDHFYRQELWLRYYLSKRLQLVAQLPYQIHQRRETNGMIQIQGLGDWQINALYQLLPWQQDQASFSNWSHSLYLGAGLGLPTGPFMQRDAGGAMLPALFQIGSGAYSGMLRSLYLLKYRESGLLLDFSHRRFRANELDYQLGAQSALSLIPFHNIGWGANRLIISSGLLYEDFGPDLDFGQTKPSTGGATLLWHGGLDYYQGAWMFQAFAQKGIWDQLPAGMPASAWRLGLSVMRSF